MQFFCEIERQHNKANMMVTVGLCKKGKEWTALRFLSQKYADNPPILMQCLWPAAFCLRPMVYGLWPSAHVLRPAACIFFIMCRQSAYSDAMPSAYGLLP